MGKREQAEERREANGAASSARGRGRFKSSRISRVFCGRKLPRMTAMEVWATLVRAEVAISVSKATGHL